MTLGLVLFWVVLTASLFFAGLALQIRWLAGHALRKALEEEWPAIDGLSVRTAIASASRLKTEGQEDGEHAAWLLANYALPLGVISRARRTLPILLFIAAGTLALGRLQGYV